VKKILRGQQRELTARFIAFRSHWQYQAEFCTPSEGHEKGGVEGEVGYFRRNHWVPVPVAADLQALNRKLLEDCREDESRIVSGQSECIGIRLLIEKEHLLPLATDVFDLAEVSFPRVDQTGCAKVRTNSYSVPLKPGSIVEARVYSCTVEFRHHGSRIASHERCYSRLQKIFDLEHYLDVMDRKPGALRGSTPLAQWRAQGRWPESYDRVWEQMIERQGRQPGRWGRSRWTFLPSRYQVTRRTTAKVWRKSCSRGWKLASLERDTPACSRSRLKTSSAVWR
jgi:hypothetical protein